MKNFLYILLTLVLVSSCRRIEKMVERGEYDNAIIFATEKLAGKRKKKTKHVKALEEAFAKITKKDMDRIAYLEGNENPENWDKIHSISTQIEYRQDRIDPFLPLISKDGYEANFNFVRTGEIKKKARDGAAAYYYNEGTILLNLAKKENIKKYARNAYSLFKKANERRENYKDSYAQMLEAQEFGKVHIKVDVVNNSRTIVPEDFERVVLGIGVRDMNSMWRHYYTKDIIASEYDYHAVLELNEISISPEKEYVREHVDNKEIKDGYRYLKDDKGKHVRDTSGQKIKVEKFRNVSAYVTEIERHKAATVSGDLIYMTSEEKDIISKHPITVEAVFSDFASSYRGDRRALCKHDHNRIKEFPSPFPNDFELIMEASENLKGAFKSRLKRLII